MHQHKINLSIAIFVMLLLGGCKEDIQPQKETTPRVKYFTVGEQATGQFRRISGKVVAADTSPLSFGVGGTVEEVLVGPGDLVEKGYILARLDDKPLRLVVEQARVQLNTARVKVTETKQSHNRAKALFEKRAFSKAELEKATADFASARSNLRSAQITLEQNEQDLLRTELSAPFAGAVAERSIEPFQEVSADKEAFILQFNNALEVEVRVPETLIRYVDYEQVVRITFPTLTGVIENGVVSEIGSRTESGNAFPVSVSLPPTESDLRPGMTASVTFNFDQYLDDRTVYLVPLSTIAIEVGIVNRIRRKDKETPSQTASVFVIGDNNRLQLRKVKIGGLRGNQLEVFEGLEAGEKVVSAGTAFLREDMTVELWSPERGLSNGTIDAIYD